MSRGERMMRRLREIPDYLRRLRHLLETAPKPRPKNVFFDEFDLVVDYVVNPIVNQDGRA